MEQWAGQFFVACRNPLVKVSVRRRGGTQVDSSGGFGEWKYQAILGTGAFKGVKNSTRPEMKPFPHGTTIGGSR